MCVCGLFSELPVELLSSPDTHRHAHFCVYVQFMDLVLLSLPLQPEGGGRVIHTEGIYECRHSVTCVDRWEFLLRIHGDIITSALTFTPISNHNSYRRVLRGSPPRCHPVGGRKCRRHHLHSQEVLVSKEELLLTLTTDDWLQSSICLLLSSCLHLSVSYWTMTPPSWCPLSVGADPTLSCLSSYTWKIQLYFDSV